VVVTKAWAPLNAAVGGFLLPLGRSALYAYSTHVASGGLISYGIDHNDQFLRAAAYVDRILKGDKPADLPVLQPTKFEFVINAKTAKALGVKFSDNLLSLADEVLE